MSYNNNCCFLYEATNCPQSAHERGGEYDTYFKMQEVPTCPVGYVQAVGVYYWANHRDRSTPSTVAQCAERCNDDNNCVAFNRATATLNCWLYSDPKGVATSGTTANALACTKELSTPAPTPASMWTKGPNGVACDDVCGQTGRVCNSGRQSALTTNALVEAAFSAAGYTCRGFHGPRSYPGAPFSTGRGDDCAPIIAGSVSTCSANDNQGHAALCYCEAP